jgi:hypothetical protein
LHYLAVYKNLKILQFAGHVRLFYHRLGEILNRTDKKASGRVLRFHSLALMPSFTLKKPPTGSKSSKKPVVLAGGHQDAFEQPYAGIRRIRPGVYRHRNLIGSFAGMGIRCRLAVDNAIRQVYTYFKHL